MAKLWGGRFGKELHQEVLAFTSSLSVDQRLWPHDIEGSQAHARMLGKCGIISLPDSEKIVRGVPRLRCGQAFLRRVRVSG